MEDDQLAQLEHLHGSGVLSDAEYEAARARIVGPPLPAASYAPPPPYTPPPGHRAQQRQQRGRGPLIALALIFLAAIAGLAYLLTGSSSNPKPRMITVNGTLTLLDPDGYTSPDGVQGQTCTGTSGYDDINEGAEVVISDDTGKTLVITSLGQGELRTGCRFPFTTSIPAGKGYYGITVTHRGTVKFPEIQMSAPELTLGSG